MTNPITILHIADLHFGMENYGHTNSQTGLHTRLEDFSNSLKQAIDYSIDLPVDLAVFAGDAYKRNSPSPTEQRELVKHVQRLADAGIPVVMISGNHDIPVMHGKASSIDIFRSLRPGIFHIFVNRPTLGDNKPPVIETKNGPIAVCCLPYISPSFLLNIPEYQGFTGEELTHAFEDFYSNVLRDMQDGLPDDLPRILVSHLTVHGAQLGGYHGAPLLSDEIQILPSTLANAGYDYVALGHIHLHQDLSPRPEIPVVYCGSIDRVDFSEAEEIKGFVIAKVKRGRSEFEYRTVDVREFVDIRIKHKQDSDLTQRILDELKMEPIKEAVVRVRYEASEEEVQQIDLKAIHEALRPAHHKAGLIRIPLESNSKRRGSTLSEDAELADALAAYFNEHEDFKQDAQALLEKAKDIEQSIKLQ